MIDMKSIILFTLLWVSVLPTWVKFILTIALVLDHSKQSRLFKITIYKIDNDYVSRYNYKANLFKQH